MDLHYAYLQEIEVVNKLEILKEMSLRLSPQLYDKYPLLQESKIKDSFMKLNIIEFFIFNMI